MTKRHSPATAGPLCGTGLRGPLSHSTADCSAVVVLRVPPRALDQMAQHLLIYLRGFVKRRGRTCQSCACRASRAGPHYWTPGRSTPPGWIYGSKTLRAANAVAPLILAVANDRRSPHRRFLASDLAHDPVNDFRVVAACVAFDGGDEGGRRRLRSFSSWVLLSPSLTPTDARPGMARCDRIGRCASPPCDRSLAPPLQGPAEAVA